MSNVIYEYSIYYPTSYTSNNGIVENPVINISLCNENDTSTTINGNFDLFRTVHDFNDVYRNTATVGQDYTGGMGTFSPSPFYTDEVAKFCEENVYQRTIDAMAAEGREFKGVLFCGLMLTEKGPRVLEFNARFGDPEAQVVIPRLKNDIVDVMEACADGTLDQIELEFEDNAAVCVMLASDGYPVSYKKGFEISGLDSFKDKEGYYVFHSGTKFADGKVVTNGGRVLGVTALGKDLKEARANAYEATELISFDNKYMRHDIGKAIDEA
jgi:phosphoribosylamine--glycine ligase